MRYFVIVLFSVAAALLLTAPAGAPTATFNPPSKLGPSKDPNVLKEKAYRDALRKIPDVKGPSDPWSNARITEAPKTPPKPRTKGAAN